MRIEIEDDETFTVVWSAQRGGEAIATCGGFATHEAAQDFIHCMWIKTMRSLGTKAS